MAAGTAVADPMIESISVRGGSVREIAVTLDGAKASDPAAYTLFDRDDRVPLVADAVEQTDLALAIVVQAGDPVLAGALDQLGLERFSGLLGSGVVIEYGSTARVIGEGRLDELRDAHVKPGRAEPGDLSAGIDLAMLELGRAHAERRVLIVIGNGEIDRAAEERVMMLRRLAMAERIATYAIVRPHQMDEKVSVSRLIPRTMVSDDDAKTRALLRDAIDGLALHKRVLFSDPEAVLRWEGNERPLVVGAGGRETYEEGTMLPAANHACCRSSLGWWWAALAGVLAILIAWSWARRPPASNA